MNDEGMFELKKELATVKVKPILLKLHKMDIEGYKKYDYHLYKYEEDFTSLEDLINYEQILKKGSL